MNDVVIVFWSLMLLMLAGLWLESTWKLGTMAGNLAVHVLGMAWVAMMRHTGEPRYRHQPRRHR